MGIFDFKTKKEEDKKTDKKSDKVKSVVKKTEKVVEKENMKDLYSDTKTSKTKTADTSTKLSTGKKKTQSGNKDNNAYKTLVRPLITEKASVLGGQNKYVFEVAKSTNKIEIAKAIDVVYGVKPISVNIVRVGGKKVRSGGTVGKRRDWKKAIVTLPKGKSIKVYEGV